MLLPFFMLFIPDAGVKALDAGTEAGVVIEEVRAQASMLSECAPHVDGGSENVSLDFRVIPDAGSEVRLVGDPTELGRCAKSLATGFQFPPGITIRRAQTFAMASDGGVQVLPFMGVGGLDKPDILKVIQSHRDAVKDCFESRLQLRRGLAGRLLVEWLIGTEGEVVKASVVTDTLADPLVGRCVRENVMTWRFPPPLNGRTVNVTFPYVFKVKEEPAPSPQSPGSGDELMPIAPQRTGPQPSGNSQEI